MLHAAALADIEDNQSADAEAYKFDLLDVTGIDEDSLTALLAEDSKVELLYQWIQNLVVESIGTGVLNMPAPILSRAFQEVAQGMVCYHESAKLSRTPFPFPYAQTCDCLLIWHWLLIPAVTAPWVASP